MTRSCHSVSGPSGHVTAKLSNKLSTSTVGDCVQTDDLALAQLAARNNAEWCDIVCRSHRVMGTFHPDARASATRTPEFYPDAVALDRSLSVKRVLSYVDDSTGCSIKDSFGVMDLRAAAFRVLFEAEWVYLGAQLESQGCESGLRWEAVRDAGS